jgi:hypothetical protein
MTIASKSMSFLVKKIRNLLGGWQKVIENKDKYFDELYYICYASKVKTSGERIKTFAYT